MFQQTTLKQRGMRTNIVSTLMYVLSLYSTYTQELSAAQAIVQDNALQEKMVLYWDTKQVEEYKNNVPTYLRNRKIKHYAMTAAIVGSATAYVLWNICQSPQDTPSNTPSTANSVVLSIEDRIQKVEHAFQTNQSLFLWSTPNRLTLGYSIPYLNIGPAIKAATISTIGYTVVDRARNIFSFREDMPWFYHEEKSIPFAAKHLEATAADFDLVMATKQQDPGVIYLKKQMLLDSAHHYLDCLMSLYAFADHRSHYLMSQLEKLTLRDAPMLYELLSKGIMTASILHNGIDLCEKLNRILAQTIPSGQQPSETARSVVMQTNNLIQATVASYIRCEKYA